MTRALPDARHRSARRQALPEPLGRALTRAAPAIAVALPAVAALVVQASSPVAQQVPTGPARFDLAAAWLAGAPGALDGANAWFTSSLFGRIQLGTLIRLLGAGQGQSVLAAAHGAMAVLAVALAALTAWVVRCAGSGPVVAGVAATVVAVTPEAIAVHAAPSTASLAAIWLLLAAGLAHRGRRIIAALGGVAAALAVATWAPAVVPVAVAVGTALLQRRAGAPQRWRAVAVGAGAATVLLLAIAIALRVRPAGGAAAALDAVTAAEGGPVAGAAAILSWLAVDPLLLLAVLVAAIVTLRGLRPRPAAAAVLLLLAASLWPLGDDAVGPVVLLLPVAAVTIAATLDRAVSLLGDPAFVRSVIGSSWLTGIAAVLTTALVVWLSGLGALVAGADQPAVRAERWLRTRVARDDALLAGLGVWPDLSARGASTGWYAVVPGRAEVPSSLPWTSARYLLTEPDLFAAGGVAASALRRSTPVVSFGAGPGTLGVRRVAPSSTPAPSPTPTPSSTPSTEAQRRAAAARREAGTELAANPRISLGAADRAALTAGSVDARIAIVLAQFATTHHVTVAAFSTVAGDSTGIRTAVRVSEIDGRRVPGDAQATGELRRYLSGLPDSFAVRSIDQAGDGITARFAPDPDYVPAS